MTKQNRFCVLILQVVKYRGSKKVGKTTLHKQKACNDLVPLIWSKLVFKQYNAVLNKCMQTKS